MMRSKEEFHSYIHMAENTKKKNSDKSNEDADVSEQMKVTFEENQYGPSEKAKDEHFTIDSTYRRNRNAAHFSTLDHYRQERCASELATHKPIPFKHSLASDNESVFKNKYNQ